MSPKMLCNLNEATTILAIAQRAIVRIEELGGNPSLKQIDIEMDLTACHLNGCPLRLDDMLNGQDFDVLHDIFGIREHLDKKTGKLRMLFLPRFAEHVVRSIPRATNTKLFPKQVAR